MAVTGIIAEFNPLHTGHLRLINEAKKIGTVVVALSGNLVQRGDVAIADKRIRAKAALLCGADLVLELPVAYSMSTAQNFALGGVASLNAVGCDTLMFGSEKGETESLLSAAGIIKTEEFSDLLSKKLGTGVTFAKAREYAGEVLGAEKGIFSGANNNLAIEYMLAAENIGADFSFKTIKREGADHDSRKSKDGYASASLLREHIKSGNYDFCKAYIPKKLHHLFFNPDNTANIEKIETAILSVLRTKELSELKKLPDLSEGIENKLFSAIRVATSLEELYNSVKVKRYTLARIRRLVLSAFISLDNSFFMKPPPYVRVLGFDDMGKMLLKNNGKIPVVTKVSEIKALGADAQKLFGAECRATDLFSLALHKPQPSAGEYTAKIIKTEC